MAPSIEYDENEHPDVFRANLINRIENKLRDSTTQSPCCGSNEANPQCMFDQAFDQPHITDSTTKLLRILQQYDNKTRSRNPFKVEFSQIEDLVPMTHCFHHREVAIEKLRCWAGQPTQNGNGEDDGTSDTYDSETDQYAEPIDHSSTENSTSDESRDDGGEEFEMEDSSECDEKGISFKTPDRTLQPRSSREGSSSAVSPSPGSYTDLSVFSPTSEADTPLTPFTPPSSGKLRDRQSVDVSPSPGSYFNNRKSVGVEEIEKSPTEDSPTNDDVSRIKGGAARVLFPKTPPAVFGPPKTKTTKFQIWSLIEKDLVGKQVKPGIVYVLQLRSHDMFKIGYTESRVYKRYRSQCCLDVLLVAESESHFVGAHRAEQLVHADLFEDRKYLEKCPDCGKGHIEWFQSTIREVTDSVNRWTRFVEHPDTYVNGKLSDKARASLSDMWSSEAIVRKLQDDCGNARPKNLKFYKEGVPPSEFKLVSTMRPGASLQNRSGPLPSEIQAMNEEDKSREGVVESFEMRNQSPDMSLESSDKRGKFEPARATKDQGVQTMEAYGGEHDVFSSTVSESENGAVVGEEEEDSLPDESVVGEEGDDSRTDDSVVGNGDEMAEHETRGTEAEEQVEEQVEQVQYKVDDETDEGELIGDETSLEMREEEKEVSSERCNAAAPQQLPVRMGEAECDDEMERRICWTLFFMDLVVCCFIFIV
ncbi:hypothetical protein BKA56DRAFT_567274 [Ilyonectria sp. MPI-CAGE-AT-0026]|nr:hypothetical protein BKA56DRAFT_567274 [Ilyonectria sp. MPI-CAGE-AT-0026]